MKKFFTLFVMMLTMASSNTISAQGWPENYNGVMLQGFYWDSFKDSKWTYLQEQADELAPYFSLVWIPQSANCGGQSMGYDDLYWFSNYNSSFGTETELRNLITTFKNKGIGTIADVVVNHRKNVSNWVDFPRETYNGVTYVPTTTEVLPRHGPPPMDTVSVPRMIVVRDGMACATSTITVRMYRIM